MLEQSLVAAVVALAITTCLLPLAGRIPLPGRPRRVLLAVGIVVATFVVGSLPSTFVTVAVIAGLTISLPRRLYVTGAAFLASLLTAFALYAVYLVQATVLLGGDPPSLALGVVLLVLEIAAMFLLATSAFEMVDGLCAPPVVLLPAPAPERWPVVCLQVPTYNEPPELVLETIRSLVALDYPALRIQVIDNNTTDDDLWKPIEAECTRLREAGHAIDFVHLPTWPGYKSGALNWGLAHLAQDVEILGIIDADYVVEADWLLATIPHFGDPQVAFVQTPQDYRAWETSGFYRACYVGFAYFFKVGMVSRARRNSIIFAGTMGLVRRQVLDEIGGWDERIITEDAEASLRILALGHRAVYVPRAYGRGIMPLSYEGLRKQRYRWAFGGVQILRRHWRALLLPRSGLTIGQRYDYFVGGLWWFNDGLTLGFTVFVAAAALGAIAGRPFVVQRLSGVGLVLPVAFIALNLVRYLWALRATTGAGPALAMAALRVNLSLSWVIALACVRGLSGERGVFLRTPKFRGTPAMRELRLVWVETAIAGAGTVLMIAVILKAGFAPVGLTLAGLLVWSVLIYGSATGYALGDPTRAPLGDALRAKARLEISPRVGRLGASRPARAGVVGAALLAVALASVLALESGRAPVAELPFRDVPDGPIQVLGGGPAPSPDATSTPSPPGAPPGTGSGSPGPGETRSPSGSAAPGSTPGPTPARTPPPTASSAATPTPAPSPTATPRPTPPVPVPTPTTQPPAPPSPRRTPPPHPTPSPQVP